jgi:WD40 repeat protein
MRYEGTVAAVVFSPDGKTVVTGSSDKTAKLWEAETGVPRGAPMKHDDLVYAAAFSPDGKTFITGSGGPFAEGTARLWSVDLPTAHLPQSLLRESP